MFVGEVRKSSVSWVRFRVVEPFLNTAPSDDFIAQLTSDMYANGMPLGLPSFKVGTRWLVEAKRRSPEDSWTTGVCTRTKALDRAAGDLDTLRHWLANQPLPARITGEVFDPRIRKDIPGIALRITGGDRTLTVVSDAQGHFAFEDVVLGMYQLEALLPSGTVTQPVDLIHGWCAYSVIGPR